MTKVTNKEFQNLLSTLASEQTFSVELTDSKLYEFKQLNTNQLKELVKTVVDSPLTQTLFNNAIFGKTMENVEKRIEVKLLTSEKQFLKQVSKPYYKNHKIFSNQ